MRRRVKTFNSFGDASPALTGKLSVFEVKDQRAALETLARMAERATIDPLVEETAQILTADCRAPRINGDENDYAEVEAIFNAVKHGDERIPWLARGVRYVPDARFADRFTAPRRLLERCQRGACGGDCDDHAALLAALLGSLGFLTGLRVWGRSHDNYVHVYAVVAMTRKEPKEVLGLDTTVHESYVGWEPPGGVTLTGWLE